ncbi:MAG: phosphate signaling complex protein PhoU [Candidatus Cyclobacteriaceae bacterium M2_1C_046]
MTTLQLELDKLHNSVIEMAELGISQLKKSKEAFLNTDKDIAQEIIHNEKRMNALELSIDRDCENIFALLNPVAIDLRFVISVLKINSDLERIGDYADSIADYVVEFDIKINKDLIKALKVGEMFDRSIAILEDVKTAFETGDTKLARTVFKKDVELNNINKDASKIISGFVKENPSLIRHSLFMFSVIRKLERVGDHVTNIAEDLIFYQEAEVLKHKKLKKKMK